MQSVVKKFKDLIEDINHTLTNSSLEEKNGLWANVHAKRKRIKAGSGEKMNKMGSKDAPTKKEVELASESITVAQGTTGKRVKWNPSLQGIRMADGTIRKLPPGKSGSSGGGGAASDGSGS